ncbi:helix-turn-helix domain-containing protein [Pseudohalocynthiibacter aestuariivivens]|uniref:Helix-turn-helix domain-containing protein n=1 Tax=Pseudohalocynthiibacter aestuariivivens TaxID=1591409 RepID=A0ABV5JCQ0_9RHOB|nr:helix-turn-helix domain-containing protein [Pseudohalocynthiibacter aestuariivivens]MBS9717275.1 helix-turn-helix domain-containing protein [Pseudohalocynthiibacter aestuariivivens]
MIECDEDAEALIVRLGRGRTPASIIICSDTEARIVEKTRLLSLLRLANRNGVPIYGVGGAAWLIAETGILKDGKGTVHWKSLAAFAEQYSDVCTEDALLSQMARCRVAPENWPLSTWCWILLALFRLRRRRPRQINCWFQYRGAGIPANPDRRRIGCGMCPMILSDAVRVVAYNIEYPLQATQVAEKCGVSVHQLERSFQNHLSTSPMQYYTQLRLEHAHNLTTQTNMTVLEVAVASGFGSTGALTKNFARRYGETPKQRRQNARRLSVAEAL